MMILLLVLVTLFGSTHNRSIDFTKQLQEVQNYVKLSDSEMVTLSEVYLTFKEKTSKCFAKKCYYQTKPKVARKDLNAVEYADARSKCRTCMGGCQDLYKDELTSVGNLMAKYEHYNNLDDFDGMGRPELGLLYWKEHKNDIFGIGPVKVQNELKIMREQTCV